MTNDSNLFDAAAAARAAADKAAADLKAWSDWRLGPGMVAQYTAGQPGHPDVDEPAPATVDALRRLADAFEAAARGAPPGGITGGRGGSP